MNADHVIAARQSAAATAALLDFAADGYFAEIDVVEKLAEALVITIGLRLAEIEACDLGYTAALNDLRTHAATFIEGWAG